MFPAGLGASVTVMRSKPRDLLPNRFPRSLLLSKLTCDERRLAYKPEQEMFGADVRTGVLACFVAREENGHAGPFLYTAQTQRTPGAPSIRALAGANVAPLDIGQEGFYAARRPLAKRRRDNCGLAVGEFEDRAGGCPFAADVGHADEGVEPRRKAGASDIA
jgi:hypothetical protein